MLGSTSVQPPPAENSLKQEIIDGMKKIPGVPVVPDDWDTLYTLRYRKNGIVSDLHFWYTSNQFDAENAARSFCSQRRFRYVWVNNFAVDITAPPKEDRE